MSLMLLLCVFLISGFAFSFSASSVFQILFYVVSLVIGYFCLSKKKEYRKILFIVVLFGGVISLIIICSSRQIMTILFFPISTFSRNTCRLLSVF